MTKAIVDVVINDSAWKAFNSQVEAHRKTLAGLPGQWGLVGKSVEKASNAAAKFVARIAEQAKAFKDANTLAGKLTVTMKAADRLAASMAKSTLAIARNLKEATKSLLSWGAVMGLISGVLGAGGLFGIMRMAQNISGGQASALGSGSSYGGTKAAGISYGQALGGEGGVLSLMNTMAKEKESGGVMFRRVGMAEDQWKNKSPAEIIGPFLQAVQEAYKKAPAGAKAKAMETLAPELDYNTILRVSQMNVRSMEDQFKARKKELELSTGTQNAFTRFQQMIETISESLQNLLATAIGPLLPALADFGKGLRNALGVIIKSPLVKGAIAGAGKALESGAKYLTSEQFSKDFQSFIDQMREIGQAISDTAKFIHKWVGTDDTGDAARMRKMSSEATPATFSTDPRKLVEQIPGQAPAKGGGSQTFTFKHTFEDRAGNAISMQTAAAAR